MYICIYICMYIYIYVYKNIKQFCKHIYRMKKRYFWNKCCIISFLSIVEELKHTS